MKHRNSSNIIYLTCMKSHKHSTDKCETCRTVKRMACFSCRQPPGTSKARAIWVSWHNRSTADKHASNKLNNEEYKQTWSTNSEAVNEQKYKPMDQLEDDTLLQHIQIVAPQSRAHQVGQKEVVPRQIQSPHDRSLKLQEQSDEPYNSPEIPTSATSQQPHHTAHGQK